MPPSQAIQSHYPVPNGQRLVARRGSRSAPDPFAQHIDADKSRHVRSRLTLVCVPSPVEDPIVDIAIPTRPGRSQSASATLTPRSRMSFSTVSFASAEDPVTRKQSHSISGPGRRSSQHVVRRPSLTAQQICDLASSSLAGHDDVIPKSPFRPVPASYHLPFIQRVQEVTELLSHPPNARLMTLLSLTFPLHNRDVSGQFTEDSTDWSFTTLMKYITTVDRDTANDVEWISKIQKSIRSHNEAMWERLREVLGVLPELDADEPFYKYSRPSQVFENTLSFEGDDGGRCKGELTNSTFNEAWLEPVFPEEKSNVKSLAGSLPGGMTPIGEEDEPQGELDGEPQESEEEELEEFDLKGEAQRSPKKISALRINTAYQFLPGTVPKVEQISSSTRPSGEAIRPPPEEHSMTSPPLANAKQGQPAQADSPNSSKHDNALAPQYPLARRWSSHHDVERPSPYPISPILKICPKRRQSIEVAPRFPTTFAKLSPVDTPSLAQQCVHAGTVH